MGGGSEEPPPDICYIIDSAFVRKQITTSASIITLMRSNVIITFLCFIFLSTSVSFSPLLVV